MLELLSDPSTEIPESARGMNARRGAGEVDVKYIEPHGHMVSRTTDDYERMALAGCVAISELLSGRALTAHR